MTVRDNDDYRQGRIDEREAVMADLLAGLQGHKVTLQEMVHQGATELETLPLEMDMDCISFIHERLFRGLHLTAPGE